MCNDYLEKIYTCIQIFLEKYEDFALRDILIGLSQLYLILSGQT